MSDLSLRGEPQVRRSNLLALIALVLLLSISLTGCSRAWKTKFIRKRKKETGPPPAILVLQPDYKAIYPPAVRYREHYAFWKSWHSELLISLGQIHKRDVSYLNGVIGELRSMQALLSGPSAQRMHDILVELSDMQDQWERAPATWQMPASDRTRLERFQREISKKFNYSDVKEELVQDREPPEAPVEKPKQP